MIALAPGEVHVWYLFPSAFPQALEPHAFEVMSSEERARHARFRFARDRRQFLLTRALARTTLSKYADLDPAAWRFEASPFGRPEIAGRFGLHFNLSHTEGLIACIVGAEPEIGIDVEAITDDHENLELAARHFSRAELAALRDLPRSAQPARFFELWTLREAFLKARGLGLRVPLEQLSFKITGAVTTGCDPMMEPWQFDRLYPSAAHRVAIAVRRHRQLRIQVVERTATGRSRHEG